MLKTSIKWTWMRFSTKLMFWMKESLISNSQKSLWTNLWSKSQRIEPKTTMKTILMSCSKSMMKTKIASLRNQRWLFSSSKPSKTLPTSRNLNHTYELIPQMCKNLSRYQSYFDPKYYKIHHIKWTLEL